MVYPESLENLITYLKKLPGIGEKSAERLALSIYNFNKEDASYLSKSITDVKEKITKCNICNHLTEGETCHICLDENREKSLICIVEDYKSVFLFEKIGTFKGVYHILNNLISPLDGIGVEDINIESLLTRLKDIHGDIELIIALKPSIEGETTSLYIKEITKDNKKIKVTRLSYGVPVGAEIEYLDSLTLDRALTDRQTI